MDPELVDKQDNTWTIWAKTKILSYSLKFLHLSLFYAKQADILGGASIG